MSCIFCGEEQTPYEIDNENICLDCYSKMTSVGCFDLNGGKKLLHLHVKIAKLERRIEKVENQNV